MKRASNPNGRAFCNDECRKTRGAEISRKKDKARPPQYAAGAPVFMLSIQDLRVVGQVEHARIVPADDEFFFVKTRVRDEIDLFILPCRSEFGGKISLGAFRGATFSLLPFGACVHILDSRGCKYAYPQAIAVGECRGISNIVESEDAFVALADGDVALILINRGKV